MIGIERTPDMLWTNPASSNISLIRRVGQRAVRPRHKFDRAEREKLRREQLGPAGRTIEDVVCAIDHSASSLGKHALAVASAETPGLVTVRATIGQDESLVDRTRELLRPKLGRIDLGNLNGVGFSVAPFSRWDTPILTAARTEEIHLVALEDLEPRDTLVLTREGIEGLDADKRDTIEELAARVKLAAWTHPDEIAPAA
jgi:hypothetical protein